MKTTLSTTLIFVFLGLSVSLQAQGDTCPSQIRMKEGSCIIIEYPSTAEALEAVDAPAETMIVSESSYEESNGVYIAQFHCSGNEVIYTKAGVCSCTDYEGSISATLTFTHAQMTCKFDAAGVLPVEFTYFNAVKEGDMTQLSWATSFESNNEGFYLEKSTDGKFFQEFSFIVGEGDASEEITYEALDRDPSQGVNYYRLKQVDFNGNERYSEVEMVDFRKTDGIIVGYNSTRNELLITSEKELQSIEIFDMAGVRVYKGAFERNENEKAINLSAQQTGHFVALITDARGNVESTKFAKL